MTVQKICTVIEHHIIKLFIILLNNPLTHICPLADMTGSLELVLLVLLFLKVRFLLLFLKIHLTFIPSPIPKLEQASAFFFIPAHLNLTANLLLY